MVTGQLEDTTTRGLVNSRIGQVADWTSRGLNNSRMPPATLCALFSILGTINCCCFLFLA